mgnify:CR=1 FL=1
MKTAILFGSVIAFAALSACQTTDTSASGSATVKPTANFVAKCPHPHDKRDPWLARTMSEGTTAEKLTASWSPDHLEDKVLAAAITELNGTPFPGSEEERMNLAQCWKRLQ